MVLVKSDPMTHCTFQFSGRYNNISFQATVDTGVNGCQFKQIEYSHPEYWNTLVVPLTDEQEDRAYQRATDINGCEYDLLGAIEASTENKPIIPRDPNKFWCSKAIADLLKAAGKFLIFQTDQYLPTWLYFEVLFWLTANETLENP
jgi:hypothetical protein